MPSQMQGSTAPSTEPRPNTERPTLVPGQPQRRRAMWAAACALAIVIAGIGYWQYARRVPKQEAAKAAIASIRTAKVASGPVERRIRLTGMTAAQNFATLIAPQMHGARHGPSANVNTTPSMPASNIRATASVVGSSSQSAASVAGSSGSSAGASGGSSGGMQNLTRFTAPKSGSSSGKSSASKSSSSLVGATANAIPQNTGLGGGGDSGMNFSLILEHVVSPGARVKKGQVIATFDRQYMLLSLDDYVANQQQVDAALVALKSNLDVDRKAYKQLLQVAKANLDKALLDEKTIPVQPAITVEKLKLAVEEARAQYTQALAEEKTRELSRMAQLRAAEVERNQGRLQLQKAQLNADRMIIKSPIDGITVMSTTFRGGEFQPIGQGDTLYPGMMYMKVVDTNSMVVNAVVNQVDVELLHLGAKARVRFDAYPDLELPAHLYSVGAMAKTGNVRGNFVKEIPVTLKLEGIDPRVIPDLSVSADIILDRQEQATAVPLECVFQEASTSKAFVFVQRGTEWDRREIETGLANSTHVAVRSGLRPGEVVAAEWPVRKQGS